MFNATRTAEFILSHWQNQTRFENLDEALRPSTKAEAYAVQSVIESHSAQALWGWKIAATSEAGQKHIGVPGPLAGRYIAERVLGSGSRISLGGIGMRVAEVEFAFRLGSDLAPRSHPYTEEEVFAAVASLHPAIEVPDSRYNHFERVGEMALIADNACALWLVVGEAAPDIWRTMDLAKFAPVGRIAGKGEWPGKGSNVLGSPRIAMTWIANELSMLGVGLKAGQTVTTGTCLAPIALAAGDVLEADFGILGKINVTLDD